MDKEAMGGLVLVLVAAVLTGAMIVLAARGCEPTIGGLGLHPLGASGAKWPGRYPAPVVGRAVSRPHPSGALRG
jgi:hypothetical protein